MVPTASMAENFSTSSVTPGATDNTDLMGEVKPESHAIDPESLEATAVGKGDGAAPGQAKPWDEQFIKGVVNKTVDDVIQDAGYSHEATNMWVNQIVEFVVRALVKVDRDNKYIGKWMLLLSADIGIIAFWSRNWRCRRS